MHSFTVVVVLLLVVFPPLTTSATRPKCDQPQNFPPNEQFVRPCLPEWAANHSYSASTSAPIATELNQVPGTSEALFKLIDHATKSHKQVNNAWKDTSKRFSFDSTTPCNVVNDSPVKSAKVQLAYFGLGIFSNECTTEVDTKIDEAPIDAMKQYRDSINKVTKTATRKAGFRWLRPSSFNLYSYKSTADTCQLWHFAAFRNMNGVWGVNTAITNDEMTEYLEDWHRHYLVEILRLDNDNKTIRALPLNLRVRPTTPWQKGQKFETAWRNSTTVLNTWGGVPTSSLFTELFNAANNPAVVAAIAKGEDTRDQVEGATTTAGLSILIAPLLFTTIPVGLFAEIETPALLAYTIATDILTVLPLGIKGIELMGYGNIKKEAFRTWVYGGLRMNEAAAMEMWYASCDANQKVVVMGQAFVGIAFLFMAIGVGLEILAVRLQKRNKVLFKSLSKSRGGVKGKHRDHASNCMECECAMMESGGSSLKYK